MNEYTPIVIDLIDNFDQSTNDNSWPQDHVSGYTLSTIQTALKNCRTLKAWRENLNNNRPSGVITSELNQLFSYTDQAILNLNKCKK